ncbi:tryptase-like protein, partial [Aphelenchoides avenae]
ISHGDVAAEGRWPWVVAIFYTGSILPSGFYCTGSLISNRYVLTAQHCTMRTNDTSTLSAVVGRANLTTVTDRLPVKEIHRLPGFNNNLGINDFTILEIPPVDGIPPVCLPSTFEELPGEPAFTIGYGYHYADNGTKIWDGLLREDFINVQSPENCPSLVANGTLQICVGGSRDPDLG